MVFDLFLYFEEKYDRNVAVFNHADLPYQHIIIIFMSCNRQIEGKARGSCRL